MLFSAILSLLLACIVSGDYSNGWGEGIDWVESLESGIVRANEEEKVVMVVISKSWCGACKALKPTFAASKEIEALSKSFVMVNLVDDAAPKDANYAPDGGYIPRIVFVRNGEVVNEFKNDDRPDKYSYFYTDASGILKTMHKALKASPSSSSNSEL